MKQVYALVLMLAVLLPGGADAAEKVLESKVSSVGLFKNGIAVVRRIARIPATGAYKLTDVPTPVHGTFWVESDAKVTARVTQQEVEEAIASSQIDFQKDLVGRSVNVHFNNPNILSVSGKVVAFKGAQQGQNWNRSYQQPHHYRIYGNTPHSVHPQPTNSFLVLATEKGQSFINPSTISYIEAVGKSDALKRSSRKPVLLLSVGSKATFPAVVEISYLTKGMSWAPSYRVDIADAKNLVIEQKSVVKNELESFENIPIQLISGFPSVKFAHVTSPLSPQTNWAAFFTQLNQRFQPGHSAISNVATQQAVRLNDTAGGIDMSAAPQGEGVDLHYQNVGTHTLLEGDSLSLTVASAKAPYQRVVEWIVPDTRTPDGRHIDPSRCTYQQTKECEKEAAWDALRFRNPLSFPMTTGPAMIVSGGKFNGQTMSYWVNPGEETTLHITKALSIRTRSTEQEEAVERSFLNLGGRNYRKVPVRGTLVANNHRKEPVTLVIRRRFSGELVEADKSPKVTLLEEGVYSVNQRSQLNWTITLKPGEEATLNYRYRVLVYS